MVKALTALDSALVRIDLPPNESLSSPPTGARLMSLNAENRSAEAGFLGPAPTTDAQTQGKGFLFLMRIDSLKLAPGTAVSGFLKTRTEPLRGVVVPRSAVVRHEQRVWVYVQTDNATFARKQFVLQDPTEEGWFITKLGDAQVMGRPGIVMLIHSQYGANTLEVTRAVEAALHELKPLFAAEKVTLHPALFRPANFVEASIQNINKSLLIGGVLVIAVLFFFLANLRSAFIAITTIPLSVLAAVIVLQWFGASLNTITLGGFAISIGVVVDDAIIGLENVWRRLRENRTRENPRSVFSVVLDATLEVRSPIVYATFIVAAVFWPVLIMSGVNGRLFAPLGVAFILATVASLVVAITLTPALCYLLLAQAKETEPAYIVWLKRQYRCGLEVVSRWPKTVIGATLAICVAAAVALPFFGGEFLPEFKEGHYIIRLLTAAGTSAEAALKIGTAITNELLKNPRIRSVAQQIGRAQQGEDTIGPEFSEFHVELQPLAEGEEQRVKEDIRTALDKSPGGTFAITPFLEERIEEILSGGRGEVVINLFGNDLQVLDQKTEEVRQLVATIPGAIDVFSQAQTGAPEFTIRLRSDRLKEGAMRHSRQYFREGYAPLGFEPCPKARPSWGPSRRALRRGSHYSRFLNRNSRMSRHRSLSPPLA